jgi:uncharacterized cupin superfamily protein
VPPGICTSFPHAESDEDEFVLVLNGKPDVWIDGELWELNEGDCVGFPAGTGIAHSVLNSSSEEVRILVVGEANKRSNLVSYPINPERMVARGRQAWTDAPRRPSVHTMERRGQGRGSRRWPLPDIAHVFPSGNPRPLITLTLHLDSVRIGPDNYPHRPLGAPELTLGHASDSYDGKLRELIR